MSTANKCLPFPTFDLTQGISEIQKLDIPSTYSLFTVSQISYDLPGVSQVFNAFYRGIIPINVKRLSFGVFGAFPIYRYHRVHPGETFQTTHTVIPSNLVWEDGFEDEFGIQWTVDSDMERRFFENPQLYETFMRNLFQESVKLAWESFWTYSLAKLLGTNKTDLQDDVTKRFFEYYEPANGNTRSYFLHQFHSLEKKYALYKDKALMGFGFCCDADGNVCEGCKGAKFWTETDNPWKDKLEMIAKGINQHVVNTQSSSKIPHCLPEGSLTEASTDFGRLQKILGLFEKIALDLNKLKRSPKYYSDGGVYAGSTTSTGRKAVILLDSNNKKRAFCFSNAKNGTDCTDCNINDVQGPVMEVPPDTLNISELVLLVDGKMLDDYELWAQYIPNVSINKESPVKVLKQEQIIPVSWIKPNTAILIHKQAINIYFRIIKGWSESTKSESVTTTEVIQGGDYRQYRQKMGVFIACNPHKFVRKYQIATN